MFEYLGFSPLWMLLLYCFLCFFLPEHHVYVVEPNNWISCLIFEISAKFSQSFGDVLPKLLSVSIAFYYLTFSTAKGLRSSECFLKDGFSLILWTLIPIFGQSSSQVLVVMVLVEWWRECSNVAENGIIISLVPYIQRMPK